jgi:hypothetical protein
MPAVTHPTDESTAAQLTEAHVGRLSPLITPLEYEKQFWQSQFYNNVAEAHDTLHLFLRLVRESLLLVRLQAAGVPSDIARPFNILTGKTIALIFVHIAFKALFPDMYMHVRWVLVAHGRYCRDAH